jgi:hypothetical protein
MKTQFKTLLLGLLIVLTSCEGDDNSKSEFYTLNTTVTSNISKGFSFKGFSFESLNIINYPNKQNTKPDFIVLAQTNETGTVLSPLLSQQDLESRFILSNTFSDYNSAKSYFDTLLTVENKTLEQSALDIKPNQVWVIKTNNGDFGKILIVETKTEIVENNTPFAEIKFKAERIK